MSGTAALAAAKRRRNLTEGLGQSQNVGKSQMEELKVNRTTNDPVHPIQTLLTHDKQIFILERKVEQLEQLEQFEQTKGSSHGFEPNDELDSLVKNNNSEIKLLKITIQKMQKHIQEIAGLVTSLRGTIANQDGVISELVEKITNTSLSGLPSVYESPEEDSEASTFKSNIQLNISDS
jgi:hypothetical protein